MTTAFAPTSIHLPHGVCHGNPGWDRQPVEDQLADCDACPARAECLKAAINHKMVGVVMGGAIFPEVSSKRIRLAPAKRGRPKRVAR